MKLKSIVLAALLLVASMTLAQQGTSTQVLHGNASGAPSWSAVNLGTDVTGGFAAAATPSTAAGVGLGTAALPWSNLILGTAATNVFTITPASLAAARAITLADPGGAGTLAYTNNTSVQAVSGIQNFTGNRVVLTSDFTDANASGLQAITGLTFTVPSAFVGNLSFHCSLLFSQATPGASDQFGVAVLTTAPTRVDAGAAVSTNTTATAYGALANLTTTTPTAVVTFTQVASGTSPAYIDGVAQMAGGGAQSLQFYVTNGTAANVIKVLAGSYCSIQ